MIHQLRIYEIFERNKAEFHARFRDHAMPIMARYGFRLVGMWETRSADRLEFAYILAWPDLDTKTAAETTRAMSLLLRPRSLWK